MEAHKDYESPSYAAILSQGFWYDWNAACYLYDIDAKCIAKYDSIDRDFVIHKKEPQELYKIIKTWNKPLTKASAHPFWYVNEIIKKDTLKPPINLMVAIHAMVSRWNDKDKKEFIEDYEYLAKEIDISLSGTKPIVSSPEVDQLKEIIDATYIQFWLNFNPQNLPKSEAVIEWIQSTFKPIAKRNAIIIDSMIRPLEYAKGGNRARNLK